MIPFNMVPGGSAGYQITNSVRLRASASAYFSRTFGAPTNNLKWTFSTWIKKSQINQVQSIFSAGTTVNDYTMFYFTGDQIATIHNIGGVGATTITSVPLYRDPSAHGNLVIVWDSSNATAGNRLQFYWNGSLVSVTGTNPTLNEAPNWNSNGVVSYIGQRGYSSLPLDGYLSDTYFIDGQALTPSSFGQTDSNGVWVPKAYTGTYGNNGFHLDFKDAALTAGSNAGLGKDVSGNGNYWTTNNISVTAGVTYDSMVDTPTNNYATLNPIIAYSAFSPVITAGSLEANPASSGGSNAENVMATIKMASGKYYFEVHPTQIPASSVNLFGVSTTNDPNDSGYVFYGSDGQKYVSGTPSAYGATFTTTDVIGVACNADGSTVTFYKNNVSQGAVSATAPFWPAVRAITTTTTTSQHRLNFGQRPFTYTPPTGFKALCTANLPAVAITNPAKQMTVLTHNGNSAAQTITGASAQMDMVWIKSRTLGAGGNHVIADVVRGIGSGATKEIYPNLTNAESGSTNVVTAFNSNGFSLGTDADYTRFNQTGQTYVSWLWKANGAGVSNTDGSITSTVSANQMAGFSIVTYTGTGANATVGHGLGVAPKMVIVKNRDAAGTNFAVWHSVITGTEYLLLNTTAAKATGASYWNSTVPNSTVFSVGSAGDTNYNSLVAYCFAEIAGYSKFGSYVGNGSADGPFVYCGFRPKYVLIKMSSGVDNWYMEDSTRDTYNPETNYIQANLSNAEASGMLVDFTANGFKLRNSATAGNINASTYIFAAFAEFPFGGSNVSPSPAR